MNIVITGGLGYVGTALCKQYYGTEHQVTVIDNRFIPEQVKQLKENNIRYYQLDVFDSKDIICKADIIYHLSGITDVAYTNTESSPEKDAAIKKNGTEASRYVIEHANPGAKIIFPSSHVVYEGLLKTVFDIKEDYTPSPVLTYSTSKRQTELDLMDSTLNYIIVRLSSVFGYGENMRPKIVPNLFSIIASQNKTIELFGGGINYKPLVAINDVARFFKFIAHSNYNRELFHLAGESATVEQIANTCKEVNPRLTIKKTRDAIPNLGYTLSAEKVLKTGFKFESTLKDEITKMIQYWNNDQKLV